MQKITEHKYTFTDGKFNIQYQKVFGDSNKPNEKIYIQYGEDSETIVIAKSELRTLIDILTLIIETKQ